jgi:hypothetical protein
MTKDNCPDVSALSEWLGISGGEQTCDCLSDTATKTG